MVGALGIEEGVWRCTQVAVADALWSRRRKTGDEVRDHVWTRRKEHIDDIRDQLLELFGHEVGRLERKLRSGKETNS